MALPNMAMIPSGYKPTKLYSVLPTPSYGSDLVTNGNFAGVANGTDVVTLSGWNAYGSVTSRTIENGVLVLVTSAGNTGVYLAVSLTVGKTYRLTATTSGDTGLLGVFVGGSGNFSTIGGVDATFTATASGTLVYFRAGNNNAGTINIDNVLVKEVLVGDADFDVLRATPATRVNQQGLIETPEFIESGDIITNGDFSDGGTDWILGSGWTIEENKATQDNSTPNTGDIIQTNVSVVGKQYKITFDLDVTSGTVSALIGGHNLFNTSGTKTFFKTANATNFAFRNYANFIGSIDNISIVEVERNNIPRLDYTDGTCPVLLTEPQSTNLIPYSEDFSQWDTIGGTTITSNFGISPDGTQNADRVQMNTGDRLFESSSTPNVSFSVYAKSNSGLTHTISMRDGGGIVTYDMVITDEWQRFDIYLNTTMSNVQFRAFEDNIDVLMWGAQVEELPYSTSIIPTNGSISTRNKDVVNNAGTSATYNSTEGTLFVEVAALSDDNTDRKLVLSDGSLNNSVAIGFSRFSGNINAIINSGGTLQTSGFGATGVTQTNNNKFALSWGNGVAKFYANGVLASSYTSITSPIGLSVLDFSLSSGFEKFFCKTSQVQVFNTALSNFDLQNLTSNATAYATYETMRTSLNFNIQ